MLSERRMRTPTHTHTAQRTWFTATFLHTHKPCYDAQDQRVAPFTVFTSVRSDLVLGVVGSNTTVSTCFLQPWFKKKSFRSWSALEGASWSSLQLTVKMTSVGEDIFNASVKWTPIKKSVYWSLCYTWMGFLATALNLLSVKSGNNLGEMGLASAAKLFSIYQHAWVWNSVFWQV